MGNQDTMAQAVFLAQLEAAKGTCKCNSCRILRKASTLMTEQFIGKAPAATPGPGADDGSTALKLDDEE